jgi:ferredoxin--NADP+ reductase
MENQNGMQVAIIGAGPAGLFAAEALAAKGFGIALFNRDIKPGGLAEYGVFPDKYRLRNGLRSQFNAILALDNIHYYGNVHLGGEKELGIPDLFTLGFAAVLVTSGAQGIKSLHLPGEELNGVIHAKDLVYHYNKLPPYSEMAFPFGKRVAIVGAGNVMADVAHFLLKFTAVEQITTLIRRGPAEVKFDRKEMESIISYLDQPAFEQEVERVAGEMRDLGQDVQAAKAAILAALPKAEPRQRDARLYLRFLSSPREILSDGEGHVAALEIEENQLVIKDGQVTAKGTGRTQQIELDNVIFAIGDQVLDELGLPLRQNEYCIAGKPQFPVDDESFEIEDPANGMNLPGIFVAGWARNPSTGLVGTARKDGLHVAEAINQYLIAKGQLSGVGHAFVEEQLARLGYHAVTKVDLNRLDAGEKLQAEKTGLEEYKFSTNEEMLRAMGLG